MNLAEATKEKTDLIPVTHFTVIRNKKEGTLQYPGLETTVNMALPQNSREGIIQKTSLVLSVFYPFKKELMENCSKCSMIGIKERASESHQTSG